MSRRQAKVCERGQNGPSYCCMCEALECRESGYDLLFAPTSQQSTYNCPSRDSNTVEDILLQPEEQACGLGPEQQRLMIISGRAYRRAAPLARRCSCLWTPCGAIVGMLQHLRSGQNPANAPPGCSLHRTPASHLTSTSTSTDHLATHTCHVHPSAVYTGNIAPPFHSAILRPTSAFPPPSAAGRDPCRIPVWLHGCSSILQSHSTPSTMR